MNKKSLFMILLVSTMLLGSSQVAGQLGGTTLVYAMPYEFTEFSVFTQDSYAVAQWTSAVYAGLLKRSSEADRDWVADLATEKPVLDGKTFKVTIRDDAKFTSGNPVTAEDVIFSYKVLVTAAINTASYSTYSLYFDNNSFTGSGNSVTITLKSDYAFAFSLLGAPIVEKAAYQEDYDACIAGDADACNWDDENGFYAKNAAGPFTVQDIDLTTQTVTLRKNRNYYGEVGVDKIVYVQYETFEGAKGALASGDVHLVDSQYVPAIDAFDDLDNVKSEVVGDPAHQEISLNHIHPMWGTGEGTPKGSASGATDADKAAAALSVRRAMSSIMNREFVANTILEGLGTPAASTMPSAALGWDESIKSMEYSINNAKAYMEEAGFNYSDLTFDDAKGVYTDSFFDITILAPNTNPARNQWSALWKDELAKIGIGLTTTGYQNVGWDVIVPRTFGYEDDTATTSTYPVPLYDDGGYDVLFVGYGWGLDWDPTGLYDEGSFLPVGGNFYNYVNATTEAAINDYLTETDFAARNQKAAVVQQAIADDLPVIPIVYPQSHWGYFEGVGGLDLLLLSTSSIEWNLVTLEGASNNPLPTPFFSIILGIFAAASVAMIFRRRFE